MARKVLLLNPPYKAHRRFTREGRCTQEASFYSTSWPPYSLVSVAAVLRERHEVRVLDCPALNMNGLDLELEIEKFQPDLLITAVSTQTINDDLNLLKNIKEKFNPIIAIFGVHATVFAEQILQRDPVSPFIDAVIRGEPEETATELAEALESAFTHKGIRGKNHSSGNDPKRLIEQDQRMSDTIEQPLFQELRQQHLEGTDKKNHSEYDASHHSSFYQEKLYTLLGDVKGLSYRDSKGKVHSNPDRPYIKDLDALPFPAWDLVDLSHYTLPLYERPYVIINSVRGCPFRCSFCTTQTYYGSKARFRSVPSILDEMRYVQSQFGINDVFFWGDTFTLNKTQIRTLCEALVKENSGLKWVANSRVDTVDGDMLALMKKAGCWMLSYGIESGDEALLSACGKNISIDQIRKAVRLTQEAGILSAGHFILGLPGETKDTARNTLKLAKSLKLDFVNIYAAVPYPGSPLYDEALSHRWISEDRPWEDFQQAEFVMDLPTAARKTLEKYRKKAYYLNYLNPRAAKKVLAGGSLKVIISNLRRSLGYFLRIGRKKGG